MPHSLSQDSQDTAHANESESESVSTKRESLARASSSIRHGFKIMKSLFENETRRKQKPTWVGVAAAVAAIVAVGGAQQQ